ncbi:unnamed protein product [Thlaspi arvense]|uniref:Uncharacterized protein n=1 Tax=Thlaspi arvense TaxID=13288 RepID=A0AAU9RLY8_THLAR|nr:unnamed protein product [Thlaspi arvense]
MGRAPCCDKANVKKGPWSPEEDAKLKSYIEKYGTGGNWIALPQKIGMNGLLSLLPPTVSCDCVYIYVWKTPISPIRWFNLTSYLVQN